MSVEELIRRGTALENKDLEAAIKALNKELRSRQTVKEHVVVLCTITVAALVILLRSGAVKTRYDHHSSESLVLGRSEQLAGKCTIPYESAHAALSSNVPSAVASTVTLAIVLA